MSTIVRKDLISLVVVLILLSWILLKLTIVQFQEIELLEVFKSEQREYTELTGKLKEDNLDIMDHLGNISDTQQNHFDVLEDYMQSIEEQVVMIHHDVRGLNQESEADNEEGNHDQREANDEYGNPATEEVTDGKETKRANDEDESPSTTEVKYEEENSTARAANDYIEGMKQMMKQMMKKLQSLTEANDNK